MMRIQIVSDLHLDAWHRDGKGLPFERSDIHPESKVLLLAGGLSENLTQLRHWLSDLLTDRPRLAVIVVPGVREHTGFSLPALDVLYADMVRLPGKLVMPGQRGMYLLRVPSLDLRVLSCTLWSNLPTEKDAGYSKLAEFLPDVAGKDGRPLESREISAAHQEQVAWLDEMLSNPFPGKTVVVTHHAPSFKSMEARGKAGARRYEQCTDLETWMSGYAPDVWVHGLVPKPVQYTIGNTLVVSNPCGDPGNPMRRKDYRHFFIDL
ncbi:hypothetical protein [Acidithiobacillus ferrooxidans]|uniref:hypothetical protein n=1 Tax=Acidithiobacillus ferrooxidans TaxID=920 RepID=UPI0013D75075|nr:hypothetical protein [Acidithiobacillus ferrooxidans]